MTTAVSPDSSATSRGKLAVIAMLALATLAASFAWWWNWQRTQKCLAYYGGEGASLIRTAPRVEALLLSSSFDGPSVEAIEVGPNALAVVGRQDLSEAKGLIHARTALLDDNSYRWAVAPGECSPVILYAVRFSRGSQHATLAFDFACGQVWFVEGTGSALMSPKIAAGWQSFLARNVQTPAPKVNEASK
jgi:hypothetical protein